MSGIYFSVYYLGVVVDLWDSCVVVFCVHYRGVVAYHLDSCVWEFSLYYSHFCKQEQTFSKSNLKNSVNNKNTRKKVKPVS